MSVVNTKPEILCILIATIVSKQYLVPTSARKRKLMKNEVNTNCCRQNMIKHLQLVVK